MRLHQEPPQLSPNKKLVRFVAECQIKFLGRLDDASLRWSPSGEWNTENPAIVGRAQSCKLQQEDD
jgi:hypothetical protein